MARAAGALAVMGRAGRGVGGRLAAGARRGARRRDGVRGGARPDRDRPAGEAGAADPDLPGEERGGRGTAGRRGGRAWTTRRARRTRRKRSIGSSRRDAAPILPLLDRTVAESPNSGRYVLGALASVKTLPPGTVDLALAHTHSTVAETRDAAIDLAGKVTTEREAARWIPEAIRLLGDPDESVRIEACWALRGVRGTGPRRGAGAGAAPFRDPLARVRHSAAGALEAIGDVSNPIPTAAKAPSRRRRRTRSRAP